MIYDGKSTWYRSAIDQKEGSSSHQRFGKNVNIMTQETKDLTLDNWIRKRKCETVGDPSRKALFAKLSKEMTERLQREFELRIQKLIGVSHDDEFEDDPSLDYMRDIVRIDLRPRK